MTLELAIKPLHPKMGNGIALPKYMSDLAAGMDLAAALDESVTLQPGERTLVPCGFSMALPPGYEAQVRPRSGLALRHGIGMVNAPGTIDADYRGEVKVLLINHGQDAFVIEPGERVAQMVIAQVARPVVTVVDSLPDTTRGSGGFGYPTTSLEASWPPVWAVRTSATA